jgi:5-methylthioadenosine/S-adenosylhomocysteine deaminase
MATINGARALGLSDSVGSLVAGKAADVICVELTDVAVQPVLDPLSQLVYCAGREHVTDTWVAGEHLLAEGRHTRLDLPAIIERAAEWAQQIQAT